MCISFQCNDILNIAKALLQSGCIHNITIHSKLTDTVTYLPFDYKK